MKSFLKKQLDKYFWLIVLIGMISIGAICFWLAADYEANKTNRAVQQNNSASNSAIAEAANHTKSAANSEIERRTEDGVREQVIVPKLEDARRRSQQSKIEVGKLERKIKENEKKITDINADRAANCAELHRLFPDTRFEYCHD